MELDTQTLTAKEWIPSFPYTTNDINDYWKNWGIGSFVVDVYDWRNQYYYAPEHILYDLDLENHTAIPVKKTFDKNEICSLAAGFHMESQWMPYCCYEDAFNSLEDIASGNIHGPSFEKSKQIEAYHSVNSSPGGDCGEKVYRYLSKI